MRRLRAAAAPAPLLLGLIAVTGLILRLQNNDYGLPYVYNVDEGSHFTSRAVGMFGGDLNPGYFQNPSGFTYLLYLALRLDFGGGNAVVERFKSDPSAIYELARSVAAVVCILGVIAVFFAGRRLWDARVGLVAAAVLCFAFLPVVYSRIAVTDAGTLLPVALSVMGAVVAWEGGGRRWFVLAGAMAGLAIGFKYTAGLVLLPLVGATLLRARSERRALFHGALGLGAAVLAFLVTTPYFLLDIDTALRQIEAQAQTAGDFPKLGQEQDQGHVYYLHSLTWGLGLLAALATLGGAVLELRRNRTRGILLLLFPVAIFLYLGFQSRFFGRWLLPAYPVLALLCAVALVRLSEAVPRVGPRARLAVLAGITLLVLAQPLAADLRTGSALARTDTRQVARDWLVERFPPRLRAVIEPAVPGRWYRLIDRRTRVPVAGRKQFVRGFIKDIAESRIDYASTLSPETIDLYRDNGFCVVVTMSVIRGRAENAGQPAPLAYYERLERESDLLLHLEPYRHAEGPVRFHFDLSYNLYPDEFARPGPAIDVYRLRDCEQQFGVVPPGLGTPGRPAPSVPPAGEEEGS